MNGELVLRTRSLRSLDTRPLRAFIMKSICSFIICISATMWSGAVFVMDGRHVSCRFGLLGMLLPFGSSWSFLSALVPSWYSSKVLSPAFFWRSCPSRLWFCLVRCSTATARVWTCLSRVVVCGSSPWTLLVVAIEQVSTMQLFVWEVIVWLTRHKFPTDGANWWCLKLWISHTVLTYSRQHLNDTEKEDLKRVLVWYWPNTFRRSS